MKNILLIASLLLLLIASFAFGQQTNYYPREPLGQDNNHPVSVHGLPGQGPPGEVFSAKDLPHVLKPIAQDPEEENDHDVVEPTFYHEPPLSIDQLKNVHMLKMDQNQSLLTTLSPSLGTGFAGPAYTSAIPTEPSVCAGPNKILSTANVQLLWANKDGSSSVTTANNTFFGNTSDASDGDIICTYDKQHGRYVTVAFATDAATYSHMVIAISTTSDPTGTWYKWNFDWTKDGTTSTGNFADFEKVAISEDKIVISSQQFVLSSTAANRVYMYQKLRVFDRVGMYNNTNSSFVDFVNFPGQYFVTIPAKEFSSDSTIYLIATQNGGGSHLYYGTLKGSSTNPVLTAGLSLNVQSYGAAAGLFHSNGLVVGGSTAYRVADGDSRLNNFYWRNGHAYLSFHFGTVISPDTVDAIKYVELNTTTTPWTVVKDESYASAANWLYYPDIAVDSMGTMFMGVGASSKTLTPSFYITGQRRSDANIQTTLTLSKSGVSIPATSMNRWGDYTSGEIDEFQSGPSKAVAYLAGQYTIGTTTPGNWVQPLTFPYNQISGQVLSDADGNTGTTGDRTALVGWTVQARTGGAVVATAVTDASGNFNLGYLEDGVDTITVSYLNNKRIPLDVIVGSGASSQTKISTSAIAVTSAMSQSAGQVSSGNTFLLQPNTATISGTVFFDKNGNGVQDVGESAFSGWTVNLTGASSSSTTTDGSGNYSFTGLTTGTYTVSDVIQSGYAATVPASGSYTLTIATADSQATGMNFGNYSNATMVWTGAAGDNLWSNGANWNPTGPPTSSNPVTINTAATVNVNVAAQCADFTLSNSSATVTVLTGQSLTVSGNFTVNNGTVNTQAAFPTVTGTTTLYTGTVGYTGTSGSQTVAALSYVNLNVSGGSTATLAGSASVSGALTVGSGSTFNLNGQTLTPGSSATLTVGSGSTLQTGGTSLSGFSSYTLNSTSSVQYTGGTENILAQTYGNLNAGGSGTKTLLGNVTVNGTLSLDQQITTGTNTLTIGSSGSVTRTAGFVYGYLAKPVTATGTYTWEMGASSTYLPASLNISALTGSGTITLRSVASNPASSYAGDPTKAIGHYYSVTLGSGITAVTAIPSFDYSLTEFNALTGTGSDQTKLFLARWNGAAWVSLRTTSNVSTQASAGVPGVVTLTSGVSSFSPWGMFWGTTDAPLTQTGSLTVRKWIGAGTSGGTGSSDFNLASNWSPTGTPTAQDSCFVYLNANNDANINLSDDITIGALRVAQLASLTTSLVYIDAQSHTLTINGNQSVSGPSNSTTAGIFLCVEGGGAWVNNGNVYDSCSSTGSGVVPWFQVNAASTGSFIFRGTNFILGPGEFSYTGGNVPPYFIFDGTGTQNFIEDTTTFSTYMASNTIIVGQSNNPNVVFGGTANVMGTFANITINGSSTLDLAGKVLNRAGALGILTMNGTSKLRLSGTTGGQTGSNFPTNFSTYTFNSGSTVEYYGGTQTVYGGLSPGYQNLTITTSGTKTAGANMTIAGTLTINSGATFSGSSRTISLGGDLSNSGTFTPSTSTVTMNGTGAQAVSGSTATTTLNSFTVNKTSGTVTLNDNISCAANLTVTAGTLALNGFTANRTAAGGTLSVAAAGILDIGSTATMLTNYSTHTFNAASTIRYSGSNQTVSSETYGNLVLSGSGTKTMPASTLTVAGGLTLSGTVSVTAGAAINTSGSVNIGSGTTYNTSTFTHNVGGSWINAGTFTPSTSTINFNGSAAQNLGASTFNNLTISNTNANGVSLSGGGSTVNGTFTIAASGIFKDSGYTLTVNGNIANGGTHSGAGEILLSGGSASHTLSGTGTYTNLELNDANGASISQNTTFNGALKLTSGLFATAANTAIISSTGSTSRTSGYVNGNLQKAIATGPTAATFEIGTASVYTPVSVVFGNVTTAGTLKAATTTGDHPSIATSGLNSSKSVNRYWTLTNTSTVFNNYNATFTFDPTDVDGGANTANFAIRKFNSPNWTSTTTGTRTATSTQATGLTAFSDFAIGERNTYSVTASAFGTGTISPSGTTTANDGDTLTYTMTPSAGSHVDSVVVDGSNKGAVTTYTLANITAAHTINAYFSGNVFTITASVNGGGTINPSGSVSVAYGTDTTFSISANANYHTDSVLVDGVNQGAIASYKFTTVVANHSITAYFSHDQVTITASAGANGSITPSGSVNVAYNGTQRFTFSPNTGYHVDSVYVDGVKVDSTVGYTFTNVTAAHTISVSFALNTYTITASAGANGSIAPNGVTTVNYDASQAYTITPNTGYHVADVLVDGVSIGAVSGYTFNNVRATHTITASFAINTYTITASSGDNGTVTPAGVTTVNYNGSQAYTISPNTGYHVADVLVDGSSVGAVTSYSFDTVKTNHTISASFAINTYTITATAGSDGAINPSGAVSVNYGSNQSFTFAPNTGYHVDSVFVDGAKVDSTAGYTFTNVTANHTISVSFAINVYTITASSGLNGSIDPSGAVSVIYNDNKTFTFTPNTGYHTDSLYIDGVGIQFGGVPGKGSPKPKSPTSGDSYTFNNVTQNHTIYVTFAINQFPIVASAGDGGTISPDGMTLANYGFNYPYTITPKTGYHIVDVVVDGSSIGAVDSYTFVSVTAGHTISASFAINTFTITASSGSNGTVTPDGVTTVNYNGSQAYAITPATGYHVADVLVDGSSIGAVTSYTFDTVKTNHTISATFAINAFTITASSGENGTVTPSGVTGVSFNGRQVYTITPSTGYHVVEVFVDSVSIGAVTSYTFDSVKTNHTISATFAINTYTITASSGDNGTVTPAGVTTLNYNGSQAYAITPATGYHVVDVLVDGSSIGAVSSHTFDSVKANHTISATFAINTFSITASSGENGTVTPAGTTTVNYNGSQAYAITPNTGYHVVSVLVDSVSVGAVANYTFDSVKANHTISATFAINSYTITASAGSHGAISPNGAVSADYNSSKTFTITPDTGYHVASVLVDGNSAGTVTSYTFDTIKTNHTIAVTFAINTYTMSVSIQSAGNGTVTKNPNQETYDHGTSVQLTPNPNAGYHFDHWSGDATGSDNPLTVVMTANKNITANFAINAYTITASSGDNGTVTPAGPTTVNYNGSQAYTITPSTGYHIVSVLVDSVSVGAVTNYTFDSVKANHTISATFAINSFTITASAGANGTIDPSGAVSANYGTNKSFTITPATHYHVLNVVIDDSSYGALTTYTFTNVTANHTIAATFAPDPATISGMKFNDINGNGVKDNGEPGLQNWAITLSGAVAETTHTDASGNYSFSLTTFGSVTVSEIQQTGWEQTTTNPSAITLTPGLATTGVNFGNYQTATVSGMKFLDVNGNGVKDNGDNGLSGWMIKATKGETVKSTVTGEGGSYSFSFSASEAGSWTLSEVQQAGWSQTFPSGSTYPVTIQSGTALTGKDFGNYKTSSISGKKYEDMNGDGATSGDPTLNGWTIKLYKDTALVGSTVTAGSGDYQFANLAPGSYTVQESLKSGWVQTLPAANGSYSVTLTSGTDITGKDFANFKLGSLAGKKFLDYNGDSLKNNGEVGLQGWQIVLAKGELSADTAVTDSNGNYSFNGLTAGSYTIREVGQSGWYTTTPAGGSYSVTVTSGLALTSEDFGNFKYGSISGMKFFDRDSSGTRNCTCEGVVPGIKIVLVGAHTQPDTVTTDVNGAFTFPQVAADHYTVKEGNNPGWNQTYPAHGAPYAVQMVSGLDTAGLTFGNFYMPDTGKFRTFILSDYNKASRAAKKSGFIGRPTAGNVRDTVFLRRGFELDNPLDSGYLRIGVRRPDSSLFYGWFYHRWQVYKPAAVKHWVYNMKDWGTKIAPKTKIRIQRNPANYIGFTGEKTTETYFGNAGNHLTMELTTLKTNIAASDLGITPQGFGDLVYLCRDTTADSVFHKRTIRWIASSADTALTMGRFVKGVGDTVYRYPLSYLKLLDTVIARINLEFSSVKIDTFSTKPLRLKGAKSLYKVPYLMRSGIAPIPLAYFGGGNNVVVEPDKYKLEQNYPNPFNPVTTVQFELMVPSKVTMKIFNLLGQEVATVINNQQLDDGIQEVEIDASNFASGVYFYRLEASGVGDDGLMHNFTSVKKMMVIK